MNKNNNVLRVFRHPVPWQERGVYVKGLGSTKRERRTPIFVDPCTEIEIATGFRVGQMGRIISFMHGLRDAGFEVHVTRGNLRDHNRNQYERFFGSPHPVITCFYIYGRAWALGQWPRLVRQLRLFVPEQRLNVMHATACEYMEPWHDPKANIELVLPANV